VRDKYPDGTELTIAVSFKPPMGWPQLVIHMFCVGLPFTLVVRRYANGKS
jgi:hypothetical protein